MTFFLAGIKGTGMSHLASFLKLEGHSVTGCDVDEDFFTSRLLEGISIHPVDSTLPEGVDAVIYSTAALKHSPAWKKDAEERGVPCYSYPEYLAHLSEGRLTGGVAGTHGKTTTTSAAAHIIRCMHLPGGAVYGSFLAGDGSAVCCGEDFLVVEACEYQDHFLLYKLGVLVVTSVDFDHPDYFKNLDAVRESFRKRVLSLESGGVVIYHSSVSRLADNWKAERPDLVFIKYGSGQFSVIKSHEGYTLPALGDVSFASEDRNPLILSDYIGGALVAGALFLKSHSIPVSEDTLTSFLRKALPHLSTYPGVTARGEVVLREDGITYVDEYAHHPDEIHTALDNARSKYPHARLVVLFMPHTSSRTKALMKDFVTALSAADAVFIQHVYGSAREDVSSEDQAGRLAFMLDRKLMRSFYLRLSTVMYVPSDDQAVSSVAAFLQDGDVCITMGAGDNRALIVKIAERRKQK